MGPRKSVSCIKNQMEEAVASNKIFSPHFLICDIIRFWIPGPFFCPVSPIAQILALSLVQSCIGTITSSTCASISPLTLSI